MGTFGLPGQERPRSGRYPIRVTFAAMVAVPVTCLVLLGAVIVGTTLSSALGGPDRGHGDPADLAVLAAVMAVVLICAALMGLFARRLTRDITDLEHTAQYLADEALPRYLDRLRTGDQSLAQEPTALQSQARTAEVARTAAAIASLQHAAVEAASGEARLRKGIGLVFVSLARRNQSLLQRQLRLIDALEQKATSPAALAELFPLDHLTTRMRRHAEGLIILSGAAPGRSWSEPVPVIDVIRGAVAEVEDYKRVTVLTRAEDAVAGSAAADMSHLLAELIENATLFSPSGTRVEIRAERVANGFAIEIDDRGLGIESGQLAAINAQLATPPDFDLANADQLGLFVVGKLAARHNVRVALRPSPYGGTTAVILMPSSIVMPTTIDTDTQPDLRAAFARPAGLDPRAGETLALTGPPSSVSWGPPPPAEGSPGHAPPTATMGSGTSGPPGSSPFHVWAAAQRSSPAQVADEVADPAALPAAGSTQSLPGPGGAAVGGTYRGLPRRIRQASLSPHLKDGPSRAGDTTAVTDSRTPEQARDLVSSLQSGWERGRDTDPADTAQVSQHSQEEAQGEDA